MRPLGSPLIAATTVAVSLCLGGCGASPPPPAAAAHAPPRAAPKVTKSARTETAEDAEARLLATIRASSDQPRGAILSFSDVRRRGNLAPRAQVDPESFRIKDLPLVDIPEPLSASKAPTELPAGEEAKELLIDWRGVEASRVGSTWTTVRVSLQGDALGRVKIGGNEAAVSPKGGGGVYVTCGDGARTRGPAVLTPARWETLTLGGGEARRTARYTVVDGWFDARTCKATVVRRTVVDARALPGGVLFGFRDECNPASAPATADTKSSGKKGADAATDGDAADKCAGTSITLLGPRLTHVVANAVGGEVRSALGSFSRVTMPLRRGGGGSLVERVPADALREWLGPAAASSPAAGDLTLGVEVVQTVDDPEPVAVSYVSNDAR